MPLRRPRDFDPRSGDCRRLGHPGLSLCRSRHRSRKVWLPAFRGHRSLARFSTGALHRGLLVDVLSRDYDPAPEVILYKAVTLAISRPQIVRLPLGALREANCDAHSTLVVPPRSALEPDEEIRERLRALEQAVS